MKSFLILSRLQSGTEEVVRLDEALAAIAAEREECAKLVELLRDDWWLGRYGYKGMCRRLFGGENT